MKEIIDDNTAIIKDDTHLVQLYYRDEDGLCRICLLYTSDAADD